MRDQNEKDKKATEKSIVMRKIFLFLAEKKLIEFKENCKDQKLIKMLDASLSIIKETSSLPIIPITTYQYFENFIETFPDLKVYIPSELKDLDDATSSQKSEIAVGPKSESKSQTQSSTYGLMRESEKLTLEQFAYYTAIASEESRLKREIEDHVFSSGAKEKLKELDRLLTDIQKNSSSKLEFFKSNFESFVSFRRGHAGFLEPAFTTSRKNITINYLKNLIDLKFPSKKEEAKKIVEKLEKELKRNDSATVWNGRAEAKRIMDRLETAIKGVENGAIKSTDELEDLLVGRNYSRVSPVISPK